MLRDHKSYLARMSKTMAEKLFFLKNKKCDIKNVSGIVDFGCADGELLHQIEQMKNKNVQHLPLIGIDKCKAYLKLAKSKVNKAEFFANIDDFNDYCKQDDKCEFKPVNGGYIVNFSSVLHELFSFCTRDEITNILKTACKHAKYITIRDMLDPSSLKDLNKSCKFMKAAFKDYNCLNGPLSIHYLHQHYGKLYEQFAKRFNLDLVEIQKFELKKPIGFFFPDDSFMISNNIQFLMKMMYLNNWQAELKEDYFSVDWQLVDSILTANGFELVYSNDYVNKFVADRVYPKLPTTHRQLIYKRPDNLKLVKKPRRIKVCDVTD